MAGHAVLETDEKSCVIHNVSLSEARRLMSVIIITIIIIITVITSSSSS